MEQNLAHIQAYSNFLFFSMSLVDLSRRLDIGEQLSVSTQPLAASMSCCTIDVR